MKTKTIKQTASFQFLAERLVKIHSEGGVIPDLRGKDFTTIALIIQEYADLSIDIFAKQNNITTI